MTFHVISLPSIDSRYTGQWFDMVERYIVEKKRTDIMLFGNRNPHAVKPTEFLGYREYVTYVWPQLLGVMGRVKKEDVVFLMDGETPGMEALEYLRKMEGVDFEIRAFWHSGSYDVNDLTSRRGVRGEHFERGWFDITDRVYVGSDYHMQLLNETRGVPGEKVTVTGCPLDLDACVDGTGVKKVRRFLFAGRKVLEKGYDIVKRLQEQGVDITVSLDEDWNKEEFYGQLARSEMLVNPALQETFGISTMESFASNVPVIVPDLPQFQTTVPNMYRVPHEWFLDKDKFLEAAQVILRSAGGERAIVEQYDYRRVLDRWFE